MSHRTRKRPAECLASLPLNYDRSAARAARELVHSLQMYCKLFHPIAYSSLQSEGSAHGYCVVYSTADRASFGEAERRLQTLWAAGHTARRAVILGNKADLALQGRAHGRSVPVPMYLTDGLFAIGIKNRSQTRIEVRIEGETRIEVVVDSSFEVNRLEGKSLATSYECKFIETSVGINHNVDELLVGLLTQIRLKQQHSERRSVPSHQKLHLLKSKRGGSRKTRSRGRSPPGEREAPAAAPAHASAASTPRKRTRLSASVKVYDLLLEFVNLGARISRFFDE
ncbi:GTP-binding protein REM 1 [Eumeta japonica]|uniref:GTP-binding protein REM 1 n=1 Tax=Eumeta variegata TaxID=151549 RepID=A0A4C1XSM9_EUMVA|nr:GTP-binding protein REM 1 [Eumeta japonica]